MVLMSLTNSKMAARLVTEGYTYDMSCFVAWGDKLASEGPAAFYSADYFADYPPGYILVLGLVSLVRKALQLSYESRWTYFLLALIPAICDCATVVLLDHISRRYMGQGRAQRCLVLFAAFCPLTLFDTGIWKQIDGAFALPLLLCFWLLEERRYLPIPHGIRNSHQKADGQHRPSQQCLRLDGQRHAVQHRSDCWRACRFTGQKIWCRP